MKRCTACRIEKTEDNFVKHALGKGGLNPNCRACLTAKMRARRAADPEKAKRIRREHYQKNKDRVLAVSAAYRAAHKKQERLARIAWYEANRERVTKVTEVYRKANLDLYAEAAARRRAAKLQATPVWADRDAIREIYDRAAILTRMTGIEHHVDHAIPLRGKTVCGLHVEGNLQILMATDNLRKSNKLEVS